MSSRGRILSLSIASLAACASSCSSVTWDRTTPRTILVTDHTEVSMTRAYRDGDKARIDLVVVRPMGAVIREMSFAIHPAANASGDGDPSQEIYSSTGRSDDGEPIYLKDLSFDWHPRMSAELTVITDGSDKVQYRWAMSADARSD